MVLLSDEAVFPGRELFVKHWKQENMGPTLHITKRAA